MGESAAHNREAWLFAVRELCGTRARMMMSLMRWTKEMASTLTLVRHCRYKTLDTSGNAGIMVCLAFVSHTANQPIDSLEA